MENNEQINSLDAVIIKETDIVDKGISSLCDAPNKTGGFGTNGFTAKQLKERFDALPRFIAKRLNALVALVTSGEFARELRIDIGNGEFVTLGELWDFLRMLQALTPTYSETRGYYFKAIDFINKRIYLSDKQVLPTVSGSNADLDTSFPTPPYKVGGRLGIVNHLEYVYGTNQYWHDGPRHSNATIVSVNHNVITYEGDLGFDEAYGIYSLPETSWGPEDYSVYCIDEPDVGEVCLMGGGTIFGEGNRVIGKNGFNAGKGNEVLGSYGVAVGRNLKVGYAGFATGVSNNATGKDSFASGSSTQSLKKSTHTEGDSTVADVDFSHAEGRGTIARNVCAQHVQGQYNEIDAEGEYAHIVGWGDSDSKRKNIYTLTTDGIAWYAKEIRIGGKSKDDAIPVATTKYVSEAITEALGDLDAALEAIRDYAEALRGGDN